MTTRITEKTVKFLNPFFLTGVGEHQPAGDYLIEIEEELLQETSFPVYRRIATRLYLHAPGDDRVTGIAIIDPAELDAVLSKDAQS